MTTELTTCPNCGTTLKSGMLSSVKLLSENKTRIINEYQEKKVEGYCNKCGNDLYTTNYNKLFSESELLTNSIQKIIGDLPVISIHTPLNWDYDILEMVTGQSTTGNGAVTEFVSSFTDFFGGQSGRYNNKLKAGEQICFNQLRKQALDLGGNAVIGTDIDYSEVGGEKGMLMVCMTGTAVKLKNLSVLGKNKETKIAEMTKLNERIEVLKSYGTFES
ncbi:MAG TPA: heavy metal-binding domain-containing protein [Puia sp.]|nr:heavy metal-binding domain-containing protein [Puia sp.]